MPLIKLSRRLLCKLPQTTYDSGSLNRVSDAAALKVDIRSAPIQEEDGDATAALALVANTLRVREAA